MTETNAEYVKRVNSLSSIQLQTLLDRDECPYEPQRDGPQPLGMYHCPLCGNMVLSGTTHPRMSEEGV